MLDGRVNIDIQQTEGKRGFRRSKGGDETTFISYPDIQKDSQGHRFSEKKNKCRVLKAAARLERWILINEA